MLPLVGGHDIKTRNFYMKHILDNKYKVKGT